MLTVPLRKTLAMLWLAFCATPLYGQSLPPSCIGFTDSSLSTGTVIKAVHVTELRSCIADLRALRSLPSVTWEDSSLLPTFYEVKANHLNQLRDALDGVYSAAKLSLPQYSETIGPGGTVKASHFTELRSAIHSGLVPSPCQESAPTSSPAPGTYGIGQAVSLSVNPTTTIRFTTDGSGPTESSTEYVNPITLNQPTTIKARAFAGGGCTSSVMTGTYAIRVATPIMSPPGGAHTGGVALSTSTPQAIIRFTTDGTDPTESSALYSGVLVVSSIIKAKAFRSGWAPSLTAAANYDDCVTAVSPSTLSIPSDGASVDISVTAQSTCVWIASSSVDWIAVGGNVATSNGSVRYWIGPNTGRTSRNGVILIGARSIPVTQAANTSVPCTSAELSPLQTSWPVGGGQASVSVSVDDDCQWSVTTSASWLQPSNTSGSGPRSVQYSVEANNTGDPRTGTLTIAETEFTVYQTTGTEVNEFPCNVTLSRSFFFFVPSGGSFDVAVSLNHPCSWTAASDASWIQISPSSGSNSTTISISASSYGGSSRIGHVTIGTAELTIGQGDDFGDLPEADQGGSFTASVPLETWFTDFNDDRVGGCFGNCGAGCSDYIHLGLPNPCNIRSEFSIEFLGDPEPDSPPFVFEEEVCLLGERAIATIEVQRRWARKRYTGTVTTECALHDGACRAAGIALGQCFIPNYLLLGSLSCSNRRIEEWSYEDYVYRYHLVQVVDPSPFSGGEGVCAFGFGQ